ncbi:MAG: ABC transporter ATP-binding protein [Pseudomonadota bacterium]
MLEITDLKAGYGQGLVLDGLTLAVSPGEVLGLMGRNGVGKTTLLKTIMGLIAPKSGQIRFEGKTISSRRAYQIARSGIGYVPQGREIFSDFTVTENLLMGNLSATSADLETVFDLFPMLRERADSNAGSFSGGQQQQLALARALMGKPRLLLLDEPSEGIQPSIVSEISDLLSKIVSQGTALILVEQNIEMLTGLADRIAFLSKGGITTNLPATDVSIDLIREQIAI